MKFLSFAYSLLLCCMTIASANSMHLYNDSPFFLNASILGANGSQLDSVPMNPQQRKTWVRQNVINSPTSLTPFTVVWSCRNGANFGVSYQVSPGGVATPLSSTGTRYCKPERKTSPDSRNRYDERTRYDERYREIIPLDPYAEEVQPNKPGLHQYD